MDLSYDQKFEEMKKYIPFLENMIKRLESTITSSGNPRQTQLNKIRSLRDLLLDKKKRMKMENLLKCEQVLVNLYAKVEQRETLPGIMKPLNSENDVIETRPDNNERVPVQDGYETLPEIARARGRHYSDGSESGLFYRRPKKTPAYTSSSKSRESSVPGQSKRNYTRVLLSPSRNTTGEDFRDGDSKRSPSRKCSPSYRKKERKKNLKKEFGDLNITLEVPEESLDSLNTSDILSRIINCDDNDVDIDKLRKLRSEILGELKQTGVKDDISELLMKSYKKNKNPKSKKKTEVEEGELSDSESEAIQSIYGSLVVVDKESNAKSDTGSKTKCNSDSQQRKIQICLVLNKNKEEDDSENLKTDLKNKTMNDLSEFESYVYNDEAKCLESKELNPVDHNSISDIVCEKSNGTSINSEDKKPEKSSESVDKNIFATNTVSLSSEIKYANKNTTDLENKTDSKTVNSGNLTSTTSTNTSVKPLSEKPVLENETTLNPSSGTSGKDIIKTTSKDQNNLNTEECLEKAEVNVIKDDVDKKSPIDEKHILSSNSELADNAKNTQFRPNFYKPIPNDEVNSGNKPTTVSGKDKRKEEILNQKVSVDESSKISSKFDLPKDSTKTSSEVNIEDIRITEKKSEAKPIVDMFTVKQPVEIPLLDSKSKTISQTKPNIVSEIDILQALKNDILNETIPLSGTETKTPALHVPKLTKVSSAKEIVNKKRISIEKYKEKGSIPNKSLFFDDSNDSLSLEDVGKKQSLKLTEKECERFNFPAKLALDESSEDGDPESTPLDIYDLAPKSPDDVLSDSESSRPIIIPVEPVSPKPVDVNTTKDVDMRKMPLPVPDAAKIFGPLDTPPRSFTTNFHISNEDVAIKKTSERKTLLADPRLKRDHETVARKGDQFPMNIYPDKTPIRGNFPNMTPNMTPSARSYEMTPSYSPFESDDLTSRNHVYAPILPTPLIQNAPGEHIQESLNKSRRNQINSWNPNVNSDVRNERGFRAQSVQQDDSRFRYNNSSYESNNQRSNSHLNEHDTYNRLDCPSTPSYSFGRNEPSWADCPQTPSNSFGRSESRMGSVHPFTRQDPPLTPVHPFGRHDAPMTPVHPFGRSDYNTTPPNAFSRIDCPPTPSSSFGRSDVPRTPSHPFGRSDSNQNHSGGFYNNSDRFDTEHSNYDRNRVYTDRNERNFGHMDREDYDSNERSDLHRFQDREKRNDRYKHNAKGYRDRYYNDDPNFHREQNIRNNQHFSNRRHRDRDRYPYDQSENRNFENGSYYRNQHDNYREQTDGGSNVDRSMDRRDDRRLDRRESGIGRDSRFSNQRARSVGRPIPETSTENKLSFKPDTGKSFIIDTSIDRSFQELFQQGKNIFESNFNARRQRASSVGRSLVRDESVGKSSPHNNFPSREPISNINKNRFARAKSVGRESANEEKSFMELKADFKSFCNKSSVKKCVEVSDKSKIEKTKFASDAKSSKKDFDPKRDSKSETDFTSKSSYYPRKNSRDPRIRHSQQRASSLISENRKKREDSQERKKYGIVYSSDNIARGNIMGPGYGVKNYKIPKIKRPIEQKEEVKEKEKVEIIKSDNKQVKPEENKKETVKKSEKVIENKKEVPKKSIDVSNPDKRVTRSSARIENLSPKVSQDLTHKQNLDNKKKISTKTVSETEKSTIESIDEYLNLEPERDLKEQDQALESSFGIDDLEFFSENIVGDPVLENINALIAGLDQDLNTKDDEKGTGTGKFPSSLSIVDDIMLDNITSPEFDNLLQKTEEENVSKTAESSGTTEQSEENKIKTSDSVLSSENKEDLNATKPFYLQQANNDKSISNPSITNSEQNEQGSDDRVSTTEKELPIAELTVQLPSQNEEINSTSDSTINSDNIETDKGLPDSTNDVLHEMHSDVSSTHDAAQSSKVSAVSRNTEPELGNVENLLSLLQDNGKIKDLLSKFGDQLNDNQKLKKKLLKLSALISDDEDSNEEVGLPGKKIDDEKQHQKDDVSVADETFKAVDSVNNTLLEDTSMVSTKEIIEIEKNIENVVQPSEDSLSHDNSTVTNDITSPQPDHIENTKDATDTEGTNKEKIEISNEKNDVSDEFIEQEEEKDRLQNKGVIDSQQAKGITKINKAKGKFKKNASKVSAKTKRLTRSKTVQQITKPKVGKTKKRNELEKLKDDIKEMFLTEDVLSSTGIRMCRLAKLVDDKNSTANKEPMEITKPVTDFEKIKNKISEPSDRKKKESKKNTSKTSINTENLLPVNKVKPGPKSKVSKNNEELDPYLFESDCFSESYTTKASENNFPSSYDSDDESLASSQSIGSSEHTVDSKKKPKRKRKRWQAGFINPKKKSKKNQSVVAATEDETALLLQRPVEIPDLNCYTDRTYCFIKNTMSYSCRLCIFEGEEIVIHYKKYHPHSEIPLSRMSPSLAKEAIEQCEEENFQAISKMSTDKYVCRFCFQEFSTGPTRKVLETFFWHVVSRHTGEYKQLCSECVNVTRCPFNLDIPPPPKVVKGQLIGYICGKCNFTQISLENLKTHVIDRHNDEQTEVFTINLSIMSKRTYNSLSKKCNSAAGSRVLRSSRSNRSFTDQSETDQTEDDSNKGNESMQSPEKIEQPRIQSKIYFEADDSDASHKLMSEEDLLTIKTEQIDEENDQKSIVGDDVQDTFNNLTDESQQVYQQDSSDVKKYPHFQIRYTQTGSKEYLCCINEFYHYKTSLLISMKKHVQVKHSEKWDGYCFICKVIVTPQGQHPFKDCLDHYLDKHMDDFPVFEEAAYPSPTVEKEVPIETSILPTITTEDPVHKPMIHVRPLSQLTVTTSEVPETTESLILPTPDTVDTLRTSLVTSQPSPSYPQTRKETAEPLEHKYEETQAEVMSNKYRVVLDRMMSKQKLVQVFKCAGRYCYFTTNSVEDALMHVSTHQRIGGDSAMNCAYCDFDSSGNFIDLVSHVFKIHGRCQFVCSRCFYRAAAPQLVGAHILRVHGEQPRPGSVLKTSVVTMPDDVNADLLTRENAVPFFVCKQETDEAECTFKTYMCGKFVEHLAQKHPTDTKFLCSICPTESNSPVELMEHLKVHGLKLYQCTWCVFGADNESGLLSHASTKHYWKPPQAYLRIITNKEGSSDLRVLPLASLNKSKVIFEDVTVCANNEDPLKEAERASDLEKLIGDTKFMMTPILTTKSETEQDIVPDMEPPVASCSEPIVNTADIMPDNLTPERESDSMEATAQETSNTPVEDVPAVILKLDSSDQDLPQKKALDESIVICLDSDDEDSKEGNINLSEETPSKSTESIPLPTIKVNFSELLKCPKCPFLGQHVGGFKRHLNLCFPMKDSIVMCEHCGLCIEIRHLMTHYKVHCVDADYKCGVCGISFPNLYTVKRHLKKEHGSGNPTISKLSENSFIVTIETLVRKDASKRKRSSSSGSTPVKKKRFGPQDMHLLPINPIIDEVFCTLCEFSTKVRLNMVRHLQQHEQQKPVAHSTPVNPVPHLETNEKHFDKMLNLAASSHAVEKPGRSDPKPVVTTVMPPENASRFPKYVPERQRHTCGAIGCSYMSVDEAMLKCHWETLHSGTTKYHCVHCPPFQHLDTSKPLTALRIIAHLKMHDLRLYSCSSCSYYHHKRQTVEKHICTIHGANKGQVMVVREGVIPQPSTVQATAPAPTMDLKLWQCGLCKYNSMLRPEVASHCAKIHQSKMQFKCSYCPFRTSAVENVSKHQSTSHADKEESVFYYYYREDSIPDDPDGTPCWVKQRNQSGITEVEVKEEVMDTRVVPPPLAASDPPIDVAVNLDIIKKEVEDVEETLRDLCEKIGPLGEPNGLLFKCPLCKVVTESCKEAMQSHLYEELKYRKWGCNVCPYKAFHRKGLDEHMLSEHRQSKCLPIELPTNHRIEFWVSNVLEHQEGLITKNKENFTKQRIQQPTPSTSAVQTKPVETSSSNFTIAELEKAFGCLGKPVNKQFCCPRCQIIMKDDVQMQNHLESELSRIRWCCSSCCRFFHNYHEAEFHCRSVCGKDNARPIVPPSLRDPAIRSAWVAAVIKTQSLSINSLQSSSQIKPQESNPDENSLLVVRYEERVQTPEGSASRKRPLSESDDEGRLMIDDNDDDDDVRETVNTKSALKLKNCPHCSFQTNYYAALDYHVLRHYRLKPFRCGYCDFLSKRANVLNHCQTEHAGLKPLVSKTEVPNGPPLVKIINKTYSKVNCLVCYREVLSKYTKHHLHDGEIPYFVTEGSLVIKCNICSGLFANEEIFKSHHRKEHMSAPLSCSYVNLPTPGYDES